MVALKLCVDRLLPIRAARDRAVELVVRAAEPAADLVAATAVVIERAAAGEITLSEAKEFMALFQSPSDRGGSAAKRRKLGDLKLLLGFNPLLIGAAALPHHEADARRHPERFNPLLIGAAALPSIIRSR